MTLRGLNRVAGRADREHDVGRADAKLLEEDPRHGVVVVLARVHQRVAHDVVPALERRDHRHRLHEVRPCADNRHDAILRSTRTDDRSACDGAGRRADLY